ncbi:MAG: ribosomal protein S18-alanine N-acetyltransferase [Gemmatimonadetes bacterium]|nr:ribosomal protein S18-alanine N-acetyltransferase [Gemmatimonadota bacterium]
MNAPPTLVIRDAVAADVPAVHAIEVQSFPAPWRRESFRNYVLDGSARLMVAVEANGGVAGFVVLLLAADEAELANLAVAPAARRRGVARDLVRHTLAVAEAAGVGAVFLEVRESNAAARDLYAAYGFAEVGRRRAYYHGPDEDAVVMRHAVAAGWHRVQAIGDVPRGE